MPWADNLENEVVFPDGERIRFPAGVSREEAISQLRSSKPELFEKPSGFFPAVKSTIESMKGSLSAAPSTVMGGFGDQESLDEAGKIYQEAREVSSGILPEPVQYTDVIEDYEEEGLLEAAKTGWTFAKEQVGISTPYMVPAMVAGKVGASNLVANTSLGQKVGAGLARFIPSMTAAARAGAVAAPHPLLKLGFGAAFGIGTLATQFFADNLERQYEVAAEKGDGSVTPDDISSFAAAAAAGPQAAMDYIFIALTGGIGRGAQSAAAMSLKQSLAATTTQAGKATLGRTIGKNAVESLTEFPTELMQTVLERAQAGESISLDDADFVEEMKAVVAGTIPVVGAFGAAGTYRSHRANKKAEENWEKMTDEEKRLRKSNDESRERSRQAELERARGIQNRNESRWRAANEEAVENNRVLDQAALNAAENTPVTIDDVIEAADSRNILVNNDSFRAFVLRETNGRTSNIKETNLKERRRMRSVLSGLKVQEYVEEDGGAELPMFTREEFEKVVKGTKSGSEVTTDSIRKVLSLKPDRAGNAIARRIKKEMELRGYASRVKRKGKKKSVLKRRRTPYTENHYEALLNIGQENGRITQADFEGVTNVYGSTPYKEFISDMRVRGDLPKVDKVQGVFVPTTYQDVQVSEDGRSLQVGDYDVIVEESSGYFVRGPNGEIVDGATNKKEAEKIAKLLKHRSRSYSVKKDGAVVRTYKNKNNARQALENLKESSPDSRLEVISNVPQDFRVDNKKSNGFSAIERVFSENQNKGVLEYGFAPDRNSAEILRDSRLGEIIPGLSDWDVRSAESKRKARAKLESYLRSSQSRLDPSLREEFFTEDERPSFAPERKIEGRPSEQSQEVLAELEKALVEAGVSSEVSAKVASLDPRVEGFLDPDLAGVRTLVLNLNTPKIKNAKTKAELRAGVSDILNHEIIHSMRELDLFTANEWKSLTNATMRVKRSDGKTFDEWAKETYSGVPGYETLESIQEEAVAEMHRQFLSSPEVKRQIAGQPRTLLERVQRFLEKIVNSISGIGFDDASSVFSKIDRVKSRDTGEVRSFKEIEAAQQRSGLQRKTIPSGLEPGTPEEEKPKRKIKRHSVTSRKILDEFEEREEESEKDFNENLSEIMQRRSIAGSVSSLLNAPGDFVPSNMTAKFSISAEGSSPEDFVLSEEDIENFIKNKAKKDARREARASGVTEKIERLQEFMGRRPVQAEIEERLLKELREAFTPDAKFLLETLNNQIISMIKNGTSIDSNRLPQAEGITRSTKLINFLQGDERNPETRELEVPGELDMDALEADIVNGKLRDSLIRVGDGPTGHIGQVPTRKVEDLDLEMFSGLHSNSFGDYLLSSTESTFGTSDPIPAAVQQSIGVKDGDGVYGQNSGVSFVRFQDGMGYSDLEFFKDSNPHFVLPLSSQVVFTDLALYRDFVAPESNNISRNSGTVNELNEVTVTMLHNRYVTPVLKAFKLGDSDTSLSMRNMLRSLDNSPQGVSSLIDSSSGSPTTMRMTSAFGWTSLEDQFKHLVMFPDEESRNVLRETKGLSEASERLMKGYQDLKEKNLHVEIFNQAISIPTERAAAALFRVSFENGSPTIPFPAYRGTSLSRAAFDISSREEARAVDPYDAKATPSEKTPNVDGKIDKVIKWVTDNAAGRTISIDGIGEVSASDKVSKSWAEGVLMYFPPGTLKAQIPSDNSDYMSESGLFTSGTFEVEDAIPIDGVYQSMDALIDIHGDALIQMLPMKIEQLSAQSGGDLNNTVFFNNSRRNLAPLLGEGHSPFIGDGKYSKHAARKWGSENKTGTYRAYTKPGFGVVNSKDNYGSEPIANSNKWERNILGSLFALVLGKGSIEVSKINRSNMGEEAYRSFWEASPQDKRRIFNQSNILDFGLVHLVNNDVISNLGKESVLVPNQFDVIMVAGRSEKSKNIRKQLLEKAIEAFETTAIFGGTENQRNTSKNKEILNALSWFLNGEEYSTPSEFAGKLEDTPFLDLYSIATNIEIIANEEMSQLHKDSGIPDSMRTSRGSISGAGAKGVVLKLKQIDSEMKSFGGEFINDKELGNVRHPVISWSRPSKFSIIDVDASDFKLVGGQTGSNDGGMYRNEATGDQYYVKTPEDPDIGRNEILASKLYQMAGVEVADANPAKRNGEFSVASTFVPGLEQSEKVLTEDRVLGVQENFAVDAWLGNWDVVGLVFDNLLLKEGRGVRIDPGGTMEYRAQGGLKNDMRDGLWGPIASDIDSMRDPGIAFEASKVMDKVTDEDLVNGIDKVLSIPTEDLRRAVSTFGPIDKDENQKLFDILEARRRDLSLKRADIVKDDNPAAQFVSESSLNKKFSYNELAWEGKGTSSQETSEVNAFPYDEAISKVSQSTNRRGRERDISIVNALSDFKTSKEFDLKEITPKEWGQIDDIGRPSYGIVVKERDGNIVLREVANFYDGYHWSIAKGRLDAGETPLQTAIRELKEETGISEETVPGFKIIGALPGAYSSGYSDTYLYVAEIDGPSFGYEGVSSFGEELLSETPGFIPRVSKNKKTISADQSLMDSTSIPIALGEKKPRKLSLSNQGRIELDADSARTRGNRSYDVLLAAGSPPLIHKTMWDAVKSAIADRPLSWFKQKFIDKYTGIQKAVEKAREMRGDESMLLAGVDALKAAYLSDKSNGVIQEAITNGRVVYRDGITRVDTSEKGLLEILQPLTPDSGPDLIRDWHLWMIANRESRFEKEGRLVSMTEAERKTILDTAESNGWTQIFEEVNQDYQGWNGAVVDYMVGTGVISKAMGEIYTKYGDYIPFYREFEGEADERLANALEDLIGEEVQGMIQSGRMTRQEASKMPKSMFGSLTGAKPPRKAKGGTGMVVDPLTGIMRNLEAAITSGMKNVAATRVMDDAVLVGMAEEISESEAKIDTHTVRIDGEDRYFNVSDPLLHDSLAGMGEGHIKYLNFFSAPAEALRELVTRSPDFIMANLLRDSLSTWTTAGNTKPIVDTMSNFFAGDSESYQALQGAGIIGGFDNARTSKDIANKFSKLLREQGQTPGKRIPFWSSATKIWDWAGDVSVKSDAATRQAVYESVLQELLEQGYSKGQAEAEAIYQAAEVINFSRKGNSALAKIITAVIPFLNARVQGLDLLWRAGTGKYSTKISQAQRNRALIGFLGRASLIATSSLLYAGMVEDEEEYKNARPEERDDNWILPGFAGMTGMKIPIPFEIGFLFKTIPERLYHYYSGDQTYKQTADAITRGFQTTLEFNILGPQITKPAMEAIMNHSFYTGRTIVPQYLVDGLPGDQRRVTTNEFAATIADAFNISPMKTEHVLRGYTGTIGSYILTVADWVTRNVKGLPARPALRADQMIGLRRFLESGESAEGKMSEFYSFRNSTRGILNAFDRAKEDGDIEKAREIYEENSGVVATRGAVNKINNRLQELNRIERYIFLDKNMSADEKAEKIKRVNVARNYYLENLSEIQKETDLKPTFPFPLSVLN